MTKHQEFLNHVPATGESIGNTRLNQILQWDLDTYNSVKSDLLARGEIDLGRGRGGSVRRGNGVPRPSKEEFKIDPSQFSSDADLLLSLIPEDEPTGNIKLKRLLAEQLEWTEERYVNAREAILLRGDVLPGKGQGGSLRRRKEGEEVWKPKEIVTHKTDEGSASPENEPENIKQNDEDALTPVETYAEKEEVEATIVIKRDDDFRSAADPAVYAAAGESMAAVAIAALRKKYNKTVFYTVIDGIDTVVRIRLKDFGGKKQSLSPDILEAARKIASDAVDAISAPKEAPPEEKQEEAAAA